MGDIATPDKRFLKAVGENIRRYRKAKGYTLDALGEDIGLDKSNTYRIEQGKNITLLTLMKIAIFLDVPPQNLLDIAVHVSMEEVEEIIAVKRKNRKKRPQ